MRNVTPCLSEDEIDDESCKNYKDKVHLEKFSSIIRTWNMIF